MKRILYISLLTCLLAACTKQVPAPKEDFSREGYTLLPANIETLLLGDGTKRTWSEDAAIGVYGSTLGRNERYLLRKADAGLENGEFYGPLVSGSVIAAYYPFAASVSGSAESMNSYLSASQSFTAGVEAQEQFLGYCPTAYAFLSDGKLAFRYPCGILKVTVYLEETLHVLSVSLTDGAVPLAGPMYVTPAGASLDSALGSHTITLDCGAGIPTKDGSGKFQPFYLVLLAGDYSNLTLSVSIQEEAQPIVCPISSLRIPRIDASNFSMGAVTVQSGGPASFEPVNVNFDE